MSDPAPTSPPARDGAPAIVRAVADELARHPPFDRIERGRLLDIAGRVRVRYLDDHETLFAQGDPVAADFYVVRKGAVELRRRATSHPDDAPGDAAGVTARGTADDGDLLLDRCDAGDVVGIRAHLAGGDRYTASARAAEDSLVFEIPFATFRPVLDAEGDVATYFAAGFAGELPERLGRVMAGVERARRAAADARGTGAISVNENDFRRVEPVRDVATCSADATVRDAARTMATRDIGSILVVDDARRPVGIVTDSDLRRKVVAEAIDPASTPVARIMSGPVVTVEEGRSVSELIALVMRRRVHHFVTTEDGTDATPVTGILSEHDILTTQGSHPTVLLSRLRKASSPERIRELRDRAEDLLRSYLEQEVSISFVAAMITEINDVLVERALELALADLAEAGRRPPGRFVWLALGSEGREEQLLRTDQDNAILYEDPPEEAPDAAREDARAFFLELGARVVETIVQAGFARCPGGIMASNPEWCLSASEWRGRFRDWIHAPDPAAIMHANIFFDFRPGPGDEVLARDLQAWVIEAIHDAPRFLPFFAAGALQNPSPLGFFRNVVVERSGEHKDAFDIKARAMAPLADAARVLAYDEGLRHVGGTLSRYRALGRALPDHAELFDEAATAYGILMRIRALTGLRNGDSGRYVPVERLPKLERQTLRNTFAVLGAMQQMIRLRYQTDRMGG